VAHGHPGGRAGAPRPARLTVPFSAPLSCARVASVLTWNVAGRVRAVPDQLAALAERPVDVLALQEIRLSSLDAWRAGLRERLGYAHVISSLDGHDPAVRLAPDRRLGVLVASRAPLAQVAAPAGVPWPERVLTVRTSLEGVPVELTNLHAPLSSKPDEVKVRTLEAVHAALAPPSAAARILVGDLNTPQYESREGEVRSFARTRTGRLRPAYGERHDRAELALVTGLAEHGYVDAFRALHGYSRRDRSWLYPNGLMGFRLDHIMVRGLTVERCDYVHDWRERRLSDHSAMWAAVRPG
jgi:endonuclease/exonuclease/phosphatase family metal-dependent hydrolase